MINYDKSRILPAVLAIVVVLWLVAAAVDFGRVEDFKKPVFCVAAETADDGGSGHYVGLGYSFDIVGNFMPDDEYYGVTEYTCYAFGQVIGGGIKD